MDDQKSSAGAHCVLKGLCVLWLLRTKKGSRDMSALLDRSEFKIPKAGHKGCIVFPAPARCCASGAWYLFKIIDGTMRFLANYNGRRDLCVKWIRRKSMLNGSPSTCAYHLAHQHTSLNIKNQTKFYLGTKFHSKFTLICSQRRGSRV